MPSNEHAQLDHKTLSKPQASLEAAETGELVEQQAQTTRHLARARSGQMALRSLDVLQFQRAIGNQATSRLLARVEHTLPSPQQGQTPNVIQTVRLRKRSGTEINLDGVDKLESREARFGVYIKGEKVYKIFGNERAAQEEYQSTADAEISFGVPIASPIDVYPATILPDNKTGYVFEAAKLNGKFFQVSKGPALTGFVKSIENRITLNWILRALKAARDAKLSDPQGFMDATQMHPITFIDIHTGSTPNAEILDLISYVEGVLAG